MNRNTYLDNERARACLNAVSVCEIVTIVNSQHNKADLVCANTDSLLATVSWDNTPDNTVFKFRSVELSKYFEPVFVQLDCTDGHYSDKLTQMYHVVSDSWGRNH